MASRYITRATAAQFLDETVRTVDRRIERGELTRYRLGNRTRLSLAEVESLIHPATPISA